MAVFETPFYNLIVSLQLRHPSLPRQQSQGHGQVKRSFKFRRTLVVHLYVVEIYVFGLLFVENHIGGFKCYSHFEE